MVASVILALIVLGQPAPAQTVSGWSMWEEEPIVQRERAYHPMIRFGSWQIIRFSLSTTYMFATPDLIQQGQFSVSDGQYFFRAVMANELENSDKSKLTEGMGPQSGGEMAKA